MAERLMRNIQVIMNEDGGTYRVEANAVLLWQDGASSGREGRQYDVLYRKLTPAQQAVVDSFVDAVQTWLEANHPL